MVLRQLLGFAPYHYFQSISSFTFSSSSSLASSIILIVSKLSSYGELIVLAVWYCWQYWALPGSVSNGTANGSAGSGSRASGPMIEKVMRP